MKTKRRVNGWALQAARDMHAAAVLPSPKLARAILDRACEEQDLDRPEAARLIAMAGLELGLVPVRAESC